MQGCVKRGLTLCVCVCVLCVFVYVCVCGGGGARAEQFYRSTNKFIVIHAAKYAVVISPKVYTG
jgi:hypothetical protein